MKIKLLVILLLVAGCSRVHDLNPRDAGGLYGNMIGAGLGGVIGSAANNTGMGIALGQEIGSVTGEEIGWQYREVQVQNGSYTIADQQRLQELRREEMAIRQRYYGRQINP